MIYPEKIIDNSIFGITATSSGIETEFDKERLNKSKNNLKNMGYSYIQTGNVLKNKKFVSSTGEERAKEFMELWNNPKVNVICQVRGGEFLMEMIPYIDKYTLKNNKPKWITGYSDSSLLNFYLTTNYNFSTITGPNIRHYANNKLHSSLEKQLELLKEDKIVQESFLLYEKKSNKDKMEYNLAKKVIYKNLYNNKYEKINGRLIGGCLEAIMCLLGTDYDHTYKFCKEQKEGILWYLDIYNSNPLDLYRILWQIKEAHWFINTNGVIIGRTKGKKRIKDFTYLDALHKIFDDMNIPIIYDVDIGHVMPSFSIMNGSLGTFLYNNGKGVLIQEKK